MKPCITCGEIKELSEYYKHPGMADGHLNRCKSCHKQAAIKNRDKNIDRVRAYDRERNKTPERSKKCAANAKRYRQRNAKRYKCNNALNNAVRDGRVQKLPCFCCGDLKVEGHHADYDSPLDVVWLCAVHHKEIHLKHPRENYDKEDYETDKP